MIALPAGTRIWLAAGVTDMRKGFDGLHAAVGERLKEDVRSGALFVFTNKRHTRLKVLYFDGTGLWLMTKRLEKGTFCWPRAAESGQTKLQLAPEAFALLTDSRMQPIEPLAHVAGFHRDEDL